MNIFKKNRGFTIIETLVAISILLISIAGPLTIAEKGLTEAASSQDQLTASYLAQDLMEYVKNVRDDNMLSNNPWINTFSSCTAANAGQHHGSTISACDYDTSGTGSTINSACTYGNFMGLCQLYLTTVGGYSYYTPNGSPGGIPSRFNRAFIVKPLGGATFATASSSLVTVTVGWHTGTISNEVVIQDIIFNTLR